MEAPKKKKYGHHRKDGSSFIQIAVNQRYVFFKSLRSCHQPIYKKDLLNQGLSYVNAAAEALRPPESDLEGLKKINGYINLIGELAQNERANELFFINQLRSIVKTDEALEQKFFIFLEELESGSFDYIKFIALINDLMKNQSQLEKKREQIYLDNMRLIKANFDKKEQDQQEDLKSSFVENYREYQSKARKQLLDTVENLADFSTPVTSILAKKINSILYNLAEDKEFCDRLIEQWTRDNLSADSMSDFLISYVVNYVYSLTPEELQLPGAQLAKRITMTTLDLSAISREYADAIYNSFVKKTTRSLEEVALSTRRNLGKMFAELSEADQEIMGREYGFDVNKIRAKFEKAAEAKSEAALKKAREYATKQIGRAIREKAEKQFNRTWKKTTQKEFKEFADKLSQEDKEFFQSREIENAVQRNLRVKIDAPSLAEVISTKEVQDKIIEAIATFTPGKVIKLKTDIGFSTSFPSKLDLDVPDAKELLTDKVNSMFENFLREYNSLGSGETDVELANQAYRSTLEEIQSIIDDMRVQDKITDVEREKIYAQLRNLIIGSISVKDYNFYNDSLGFHGGSLGAGGTPQKVIDNISAMYTMGGISPADSELLLFAVQNCSDAALGSSLKDDLATYLLGGAAMMMFDDGFAATNNYLQKVVNDFGFAPKTLHLYNLQGKYIPASYVYTTIHQNLLSVYQNLSLEVQTTVEPRANSQNQVIITNKISDENIPYFKEMPSPQARWDTISGKASSEVRIQFIFMAGLLDIFEQIPRAFNI